MNKLELMNVNEQSSEFGEQRPVCSEKSDEEVKSKWMLTECQN